MGALPLGDVLGDGHQEAAVRAGPDPDLLGAQVADAVVGCLDGLFLDDPELAGREDLLVLLGELVRLFLGEEVVPCLAQVGGAGDPEHVLGRPVDDQVAPVGAVFHDERGGDALDDGVQEGEGLLGLRLPRLQIGDVHHAADPAAVVGEAAIHPHPSAAGGPAVVDPMALEAGGEALGQPLRFAAPGFGKAAGLERLAQQDLVVEPRFDPDIHFGPQIDVGAVAGHKAVVRVVEREPFGKLVQRREQLLQRRCSRSKRRHRVLRNQNCGCNLSVRLSLGSFTRGASTASSSCSTHRW